MPLFGGSAPGQGFDFAQLLAALGATLQDVGAAEYGRPGGNIASFMAERKRLGDQRKYQDSLGAMFGTPEVNTVASTPLAPAAAAATGQPNDIAGRMAAQDNNRQSMMFSGPMGQSLGFDQSNAMLPLLQNMDPNMGLPVLLSAMGQAQERKDRKTERYEDRGFQVQDRAEARAQTVQDNAVRPATPEEKQRFGFSPQTPLFMDGFGKPIPVQDPNAITPYQQQALANDRAQIEIARQNSNRGPAPPSGYMPAPNGNGLTFIPGGPADPAVAGRGTGKPTEDQAKNAQLYTLSKQILPQVLDNFESLGNPVNNALSFGGAMTTSAGYQQADIGLKSLVANFLYSTSGATATPQEVENRAATVRPRVGDSKETLDLKKKAITDMVESIKLRASPQLLNTPQQPANSNAGWGIRRLP